MHPFEKELADYVAEHGVPDRIELMVSDMNSVMRGKWLAGKDALKLITGEARLPLSTYAPNIFGEEVEASGIGSQIGDPDGELTPIAGTLDRVFWTEGHVAQLLCEMVESDGAVSALSPRQMLANMVDKFHAEGLKPVVASELEFYIYQSRDRADEAPQPPEDSPVAQNYDLDVLDRHSALLDDIEATSKKLELPVDAMIAEYGPGQFEINFHHTDDILSAADTALIFRRLVHGVAVSHGMEATFMAKPYTDHPGNGMHLHASVLDEKGENIFNSDDGVHPRLGHAVAGSLATMRELQAIFAPHYNSYRRFHPGSFSPTAPNWAADDRRAGIRLPQITGPAARMEHRICGADVNPYLAFAAILGGMLHGLSNKLEPPLPLDDTDAVEPDSLTHDWTSAIEAFASSDIAADIFGKTYRDIYAAVRRDEQEQFSSVITPMEYQTYLNRF